MGLERIRDYSLNLCRPWLGSRVPRFLGGPGGYAVAALMLLCYGILAFKPFQWNPPRRIQNGAAPAACGSIRFSSPGLAQTTSPPTWLDRAIQLDSFKIRLRVRASSPAQFGPARVFTLSPNTSLRNVTIAQDASDLVVRLRTPETSPNGMPAYAVPGVFESADWREIELAVQPAAMTLTVDGQEVLAELLPENPLASWDRSYRVGLGNELTGDRPWLGEISRAIVMVGGDRTDYLRTGKLEIPLSYWEGSLFYRPGPTEQHKILRDAVLNFLGFVPLGFVLAMLRRERGSFLVAVVVCAVASLAVELMQVCFAGRFPSVSDWGLNVLGAALGAWPARRLLVRTG